MAHLLRACMTSISFHLTAAPKLFTHLETNNPVAITGKPCAGDAECQTSSLLFNKNTGTNVFLCNLGYAAASQTIKTMWISKSKTDRSHRAEFPLEAENLHFLL